MITIEKTGFYESQSDVVAIRCDCACTCQCTCECDCDCTSEPAGFLDSVETLSPSYTFIGNATAIGDAWLTEGV